MEPVKLDDLATSLHRRGAPLTQESATFITLECVEALQTSQRVLSADAVLVAADGGVALVEEAMSPALDDAEVLRGAIEMLEGLLSSPPAMVIELGDRVRQGAVVGRAALIGELSALLVPFNRGAARRMLGRLVREHQREHAEAAAPAFHDDPAAPDAISGDGGADATWIDRPHGPLSHLSEEPEGIEEGPRRSDPKRAQGLFMLSLSIAAVLAAAWFLWSRL